MTLEDVSPCSQPYLSGYDDSYRVFSNNVSAPWVDSNNKIVIDDNIMKWVDQTKKYTLREVAAFEAGYGFMPE